MGVIDAGNGLPFTDTLSPHRRRAQVPRVNNNNKNENKNKAAGGRGARTRAAGMRGAGASGGGARGARGSAGEHGGGANRKMGNMMGGNKMTRTIWQWRIRRE